MNAMLYVGKTGCQWGQLPTDFPPWKSVHEQFRAWHDGGVWEGPGTKCYMQSGDCRFSVGQNGAKRGRRGYDAGKKIKGRKRHIAVDTLGNPLAVIVHSAGIQDRVSARALLMRLFCRFDIITKIHVGGGYTGSLIDWAKRMFGPTVEVVKRTE